MRDPAPYDVVVSTAGHDKGKLFQVVGLSKGRLLLCDGKNRLLAKPKEKSAKHVRPAAPCDRAPATDKDIRMTLALAAQTAAKEGNQLGER